MPPLNTYNIMADELKMYFLDQLNDELEGSKDYILKAIEIKAMDSTWGKMFYEMSIQELSHATNIFKMAQDYYTKVSGAYKEPPEYLKDIMCETRELYTKEYAKIKYMQEVYSH